MNGMSNDNFPNPEAEAEADAPSPGGGAEEARQNPAGPGATTMENLLHSRRVLEALLFASAEPLGEDELKLRLGGAVPVRDILLGLQTDYARRGVHLVRSEQRWSFRTAPDLVSYLRQNQEVPRKLSRAALETLAMVAYHQPVTRAEIETIRGVATSKGTLDLLMEQNWIRPGRRRETPGRPLTWITTEHFLDHFCLGSLRDLPGVDELRAAGLLDSRPVLGALPAENGE